MHSPWGAFEVRSALRVGQRLFQWIGPPRANLVPALTFNLESKSGGGAEADDVTVDVTAIIVGSGGTAAGFS